MLTAIIKDQHGKHVLPLDLGYDLTDLQNHMNRTFELEGIVRLAMRDPTATSYVNPTIHIDLLTIVEDHWLGVYEASKTR